MKQIQKTKSFDRDYLKLPDWIKDLVDSKIMLLMDNPRHPSLQLKKMKGKEVWEIRVTRSYRITLNIKTNLYLFRRVGAHDILKKP